MQRNMQQVNIRASVVFKYKYDWHKVEALTNKLHDELEHLMHGYFEALGEITTEILTDKEYKQMTENL
ncbi:hypothetical protein [Limnovirga soli]|uniref:Uncharacterized protein n=1 Tax=Limnovirga soli TaxID=2656915 RepID=A0A8J8JQB8_9BACT|nr:hypothetical protein [Limnovirga soli]NNV54557.1 hypothetical protein [Limnovirga soli]